MSETTSTPVVVEKVDNDLVEQAYRKIYEIFSTNVEKAMYDCGQYLLKTFYDDDIELARKKKSPKNESLIQLIKRLQGSSSNSPSKSWIYNSIGLIIQEEDIKSLGKESFHTYGNFLLSHKTHLLSVNDLDTKKLLISEIAEKDLSIRALDQRKKELIPPSQKKKTIMTLMDKPKDLFLNTKAKNKLLKDIEGKTIKQREKIKDKALKKSQSLKDEIEKLKEEIKLCQGYIKDYEKLSDDIDKMPPKKS